MQRSFLTRRGFVGLGLLYAAASGADKLLAAPRSLPGRLRLPDSIIPEAYEKSAELNVLAAVSSSIFPGYFAVCADSKGCSFYGNTYPSLDGHHMTDALLRLGQLDVVKANWDYVKSFQRADGLLPLAILPKQAGTHIGASGYEFGVVEPNGGLYEHWVPGNPLVAAASTTYIQNADVIFRYSLDQTWLKAQIASVNLAANYLASLTNELGAVRGSGYYVERPTRLGCDGVTQPHAMDAFLRIASLNRVLGDAATATRYEDLAELIRGNFIKNFWMKDHFAEYVNPERGKIDLHGLSDTDWAAIAFDMLTAEQKAILWPRLKDDKRFYYGGMPTGIATEPEKYQAWEFTYPDKMDLAAMGRVWYLESQARARMGDATGLLDSIHRVAQVGRESGYYWRERYNSKGGFGADKYAEYPANLIRIVQRFLLGVELCRDGSVTLAPTVTAEFWERGFGQRMSWRDRILDYSMSRGKITGTYVGGQQQITVRLEPSANRANPIVLLNGKTGTGKRQADMIQVTLPAATIEHPCQFEIRSAG